MSIFFGFFARGLNGYFFTEIIADSELVQDEFTGKDDHFGASKKRRKLRLRKYYRARRTRHNKPKSGKI